LNHATLTVIRATNFRSREKNVIKKNFQREAEPVTTIETGKSRSHGSRKKKTPRQWWFRSATLKLKKIGLYLPNLGSTEKTREERCHQCGTYLEAIFGGHEGGVKARRFGKTQLVVSDMRKIKTRKKEKSLPGKSVEKGHRRRWCINRKGNLNGLLRR